jgi:hypothetical protein
LDFKERLNKSFDSLFGESGEGLDEFSEAAQFGKRWGWYQSIYILAKGDVLKFGDVTRTSLLKCLTYLTFEKDKTEFENRQIKKQMK